MAIFMRIIIRADQLTPAWHALPCETVRIYLQIEKKETRGALFEVSCFLTVPGGTGR